MQGRRGLQHRTKTQIPTRWLATTNRSRVSIHVTIFGQGRGIVDPVKYCSLLVWSPCKIWCCVSYRVSVRYQNPPRYDRDVHDPLETRPSPMCYPAEFDRSRSNGTSVRTEIRRNIGLLESRLSRSLKVIETDMDPSATLDFILVIRISISLVPFPNKRRFRMKNANFSYHRVINARWGVLFKIL